MLYSLFQGFTFEELLSFTQDIDAGSVVLAPIMVPKKDSCY
jgi:hypothetical protein